MKILIAEDDYASEKLYELIFKKDEVDLVNDGDTFMGKYSNTYDVIMLDLKLPKRSGFALIEFLETVDNNIPVFVVSACTEEFFKKVVTNNKEYYFMQKPVDPKTLRKAVIDIASYYSKNNERKKK